MVVPLARLYVPCASGFVVPPPLIYCEVPVIVRFVPVLPKVEFPASNIAEPEVVMVPVGLLLLISVFIPLPENVTL